MKEGTGRSKRYSCEPRSPADNLNFVYESQLHNRSSSINEMHKEREFMANDEEVELPKLLPKE